ncbi:MAG: thioredoxin family protein [Desulfobulbaceae bacterium]|nr:thioredoxin family protein [Desulfobulbaceae bacterium]
MTDRPTQRTIKIGNATVGLIGLDVAINRILRDKDLTEDMAEEQLFAAVSKENYIPAEATELYRKALRREIRRQRGEEDDAETGLTIRILGPGCVSCNKLNTLVIEALQRLKVAADVEHVNDLDEIWRYGVTQTPALIINEDVKSSGRMPTPSQIEEWLQEKLRA